MPISTNTATESGWELVVGYPNHSNYVVVVENDLVIGGEGIPNDDEAKALEVLNSLGRSYPIGAAIYHLALNDQQIVSSKKLLEIKR